MGVAGQLPAAPADGKGKMAHVDDDASRAGLAAFLPAGVPRRLAEGGGRLAWRREVTVLFADLTGFTDLCEGLAPDAVAELLSGIFDRMTEVVEAHGGLVDKFLGDACMALFGALDARGDDATCAARAALDLVDAVAAYGRAQAARLRGRPLSASVGLETGPAFVGVVGERQRTFTAFGDTVNTAARLEALAGPGEVIAGEAAAAHLAESLVSRPLAPVALKGKARPQRPVRILRGAPGAGEGVSLVGRRAARTAVARGLERAGAVVVAGPPGSGKSALVETLVVPGALVAPGRAGMPPGDLLARLLAAAGTPVAGDPGPEALGLLLARVLARRARAGGLLVVTDDLDLASESDRRLLARAVARARGAGGRWLAGATHPELALLEAAAVVRVDLAPLDLDAARRLLEARLAAAGVPVPKVAAVEQVCRAVGLWPGPLVEAARVLAATGGEVPVGGLPQDLDALILARLDRLPGPERAHLDRWAARTEAARLAGLPAAPGAALAAAPAAPGPGLLRAVAGGLAAPARRALHRDLAADRGVPPALRLAHRALAGGPQGARAYRALAAWLLRRAHPAAALEAASAGLKILHQTPRPRREALETALHLARGEARRLTGDRLGAAEAFQTAARGSGRAGVDARRSLARLLWLRGDLGAAAELAARAEAEARAAGWADLAAASRVLRGNAAFEAGDLAGARDHYLAALPEAEAADPPLARRLRMNLGAARAAGGDPASALQAFDALAPDAVADPELAAQLAHNRAMALRDLRRPEAAHAFADAAARADALGDLRLAAMARLELGAALLDAPGAAASAPGGGDPVATARAEVAEAMERFALVDNRLGLGDAYKLAGRAEARLGQPRRALAWLQRAVDLLGREGATLALAEALDGLAEVQAGLGEAHAADAARRRADHLRRRAGVTPDPDGAADPAGAPATP